MKKESLNNSRYPVTLQCTCPDAASIPEFIHLLDLLSDHGFYGLELNLPDLASLSSDQLHSLLESRNLKLTYIATGAYAKAHQLSLSAPDPVIRKKSIQGCMENIRYASQLQAGIIIGFLKNNDPHADKNESANYLADSLAQLDSFAGQYHVPILLEATNRYESCIANSLADADQILQTAGTCNVHILPDTYHMNIEEDRPMEALAHFKNNISNIHISDNNRFFPGLGCIHFEHYLETLDKIQYQGTLGIEGILKSSIEQDLEISVRYLAKMLKQSN